LFVLKLLFAGAHKKSYSSKYRQEITDKDFETEVRGHEIIEDSSFVVKALEWGSST
jgi:hypothetical protein